MGFANWVCPPRGRLPVNIHGAAQLTFLLQSLELQPLILFPVAVIFYLHDNNSVAAQSRQSAPSKCLILLLHDS